MEEPSLERCLAYQVLCEPETWLVQPTPKNFNVFMKTALMAVTDEKGQTLNWKIFGSLLHRSTNLVWYQQLLNIGGHSETPQEKEARELTFFPKLKARLERDFAYGLIPEIIQPLDMSSHFNLYIWRQQHKDGDELFWKTFAKRPGMWLNSISGCSLQAFLNGFQKGQQWLNLPEHPRVTYMIDTLESESMKHFDDPWEIYRHYDSKLSVLLELCGLPPSPFLLRHEMEQCQQNSQNSN